MQESKKEKKSERKTSCFEGGDSGKRALEEAAEHHSTNGTISLPRATDIEATKASSEPSLPSAEEFEAFFETNSEIFIRPVEREPGKERTQGLTGKAGFNQKKVRLIF